MGIWFVYIAKLKNNKTFQVIALLKEELKT
jgi:hypothetical protein